MDVSCLLNPGITIFGFTIYYYAIIIVCGIILATIVVAFLFKRRNIPVDWTLDLLICILPIGIIGARTYYCAFYGNMSEWIHFRSGGLAIYGGIIGGAIGVVLFCIIHKINFFRVADCLLPGVILAQGIGRWGNFANQEAYGNLVTNPKLQWFPYAVFIDEEGAWFQATFFYESLSCLIIFAILFTFAWKFRKKPSGLVFAGYFILYGIERAIVEGLRSDSLMVGNVRVSQALSIVLILGGVAVILMQMYLNRKKYGSCFGAAVGEPLAIMPKLYTKEQLRKMEESRLAKEKAAKEKAAREAAAAQNTPANGESNTPQGGASAEAQSNTAQGGASAEAQSNTAQGGASAEEQTKEE